MLSFKHEVFLEVAQLKSFTKASHALYISQPAISKHIQQLEEEYGVPLFERKGSGIFLTPSGEVLLTATMKAKAIGQKVKFDLSTFHDQYAAKGELRLGASTTVALYIIPPILSGFHQKHPHVRASLVNRNSENVLKALLEHEIDLGIIEGRTKSSKVSNKLFLTDEVVPVCSSRSPLADNPKLKVRDLKNSPVALRERGSGTLAALKQALAGKGIRISDLKSGVQLSGTEALKNFILADLCIGFLPLRSIEKELLTGSMTRLYVEGLTIKRQFYFIQRHGESNNDIGASFVRFAKAYHNLK